VDADPPPAALPVGAEPAAVDGDGVATAPGAAQAATRMSVKAAAARRADPRLPARGRADPMLSMNAPPLFNGYGVAG
jgi:hypothetical protein